MSSQTMQEVTKTLKEKYPEVGIKSIEVDEDSGKSTFYIEPTKKSLAFLDKNSKTAGGVIPHIFRDKAQSVITRDVIDRTSLDLISAKDAYSEAPLDAYKRAIKYYYTDPLIGTTTNLLASLSSKGYENDIDDPKIKQFFDVWAFDVNLPEVLEWIFLDFFKVGHVTTYKVLAKYEPRVSYLSPIPGQKMKVKKKPKKEKAAKKGIWSKGHMPVSYTTLNPLLVNIEGNLLFDKTTVKLKPPNELTEMLKKPPAELTEDEKELVKALPNDLKKAAQKGEEYQLDSRLVGQITYRKQPYERYARPRIGRLFDTIEYKKSLRQADISTLDGISNAILKITIGNDDYPVTNQEQLEAVAELFNTPSKSFDVVWNHTLHIEKIVSPEIEAILGKGKYEQVNEDMTAGLGIPRSIIDGTGQVNAAEIGLMIKGLSEEISYARRQVTRWLYREYQQIAEAAGFDRIPKVRWDEGVLKDTILYMNTLSQLVDRRMLSYRTALEALGFDFPNELSNMEEEMKLVKKGTFGIIGSPWQQAKAGPTNQKVQSAPKGTPSNGRPAGQPAPKKKEPKKAPTSKQPQSTKQQPKSGTTFGTLEEAVSGLSDEAFELFKQRLEETRIDSVEE